MIPREIYLQQVRQFIDKPQIKILTGIRRSGKSSVLLLLKEELLLRNVEEAQIIHLNFESFENIALQTAEALYSFIKQQIKTDQAYYFFWMKYK